MNNDLFCFFSHWSVTLFCSSSDNSFLRFYRSLPEVSVQFNECKELVSPHKFISYHTHLYLYWFPFKETIRFGSLFWTWGTTTTTTTMMMTYILTLDTPYTLILSCFFFHCFSFVLPVFLSLFSFQKGIFSSIQVDLFVNRNITQFTTKMRNWSLKNSSTPPKWLKRGERRAILLSLVHAKVKRWIPWHHRTNLLRLHKSRHFLLRRQWKVPLTLQSIAVINSKLFYVFSFMRNDIALKSTVWVTIESGISRKEYVASHLIFSFFGYLIIHNSQFTVHNSWFKSKSGTYFSFLWR